MKGRPIIRGKLLAVPQVTAFILLTTACFTIVSEDKQYPDHGVGARSQSHSEVSSSFSSSQPRAFSLTIDGTQVSSERVPVANGSVGVSPTPGPPANLYPYGTKVNLDARPDDGYTLLEWTGDCSEASGEVCTLAMDIDKSVNVTFQSLAVSNIYGVPPTVPVSP